MTTIIGVLLMLLGCYFVFTTALGMIRFRDTYYKFHLASKCLTAGVISILSGAMLYGGSPVFSGKVLLFLVFLTLSSPISSHALGRAAYNNKQRPVNLVWDDYQSRRGNA